MNPVLKAIGDIGLVPTIKIHDASQAPALARALVHGGIGIAEITFRTQAAGEAIRAIVDQVPEVLVGAGTVIDVERARAAMEAGAAFIVAPGFNPAVVDFCLERGIPVVPGIDGPSGAEVALGRGLEVVKFFPAEQCGGVGMLKAMAGPFPELSYLPTGGIDATNIGPYARCPQVHAIGGSWMATSAMIDAGDWAGISAACRAALQALHGFSLMHLGLNHDSTEEARSAAAFLGALGFAPKEGASSIFAGNSFELMLGPGRGRYGHIGLTANNIDRAIAFLGRMGVGIVEETVKRDSQGTKVAYLDRELSGFAVHLART